MDAVLAGELLLSGAQARPTLQWEAVEDSERATDAARRELIEETGLSATALFTAGEVDVRLATARAGRNPPRLRRPNAAAVANDPPVNGYHLRVTDGTPISEDEVEQVEERQRPRSAVIFETIRREGEDSYERASASLFWSAVAAGGSMTFSMITMGVLLAHMPDTPWRHLVASFGYTIGFLIVILGRQQLFTENTLTPLLPIFYDFKAWRFAKLARLWGLILAGNLVAALVTSALVAFSGAFPDDSLKSFDALALAATGHPFWVLFAKAIFAGWLIALMVWLLPLAEGAAVFVIVILTYVVAAADFGHIIAGSVEAFFGAWRGAIGWGDVVAFIVPTLLGNSIGGVAFVAAISTAEIASERGHLGRDKDSKRGGGEDNGRRARKPRAK
ncbi:MAG: formate/nitrite transporter family protein [Candidatus Eremiobacteraeota bacterium]|nr:formate/nitrite transporter family protein [Candidatus Eremiobacteraeota bacterium]